MPRTATGRKEAQRLRQQRYRERLASKCEPEVQELDTAIAVALARLVVELETGKGIAGSRALLDNLLLFAIEVLKRRGYSGRAAGRLMHRRLTWLKAGLKNPDADWLTKRGF